MWHHSPCLTWFAAQSIIVFHINNFDQPYFCVTSNLNYISIQYTLPASLVRVFTIQWSGDVWWNLSSSLAYQQLQFRDTNITYSNIGNRSTSPTNIDSQVFVVSRPPSLSLEQSNESRKRMYVRKPLVFTSRSGLSERARNRPTRRQTDPKTYDVAPETTGRGRVSGIW